MALKLPPNVEIRGRQVDRIPGYPDVINDIIRNGVFIIGASDDPQLGVYLARLEATDWRYLYDYGMDADPLQWIQRVREETWSFTDFTCIQLPDKNGRGRFAGNVQEYSAALSWWIWDVPLLHEIQSLVPEVMVQPQRTASRIVVAE
jgi:hypothetical protein